MMYKNDKLCISLPVESDKNEIEKVFEITIADTFEGQGIGHLKDDIKREVQEKVAMINDYYNNNDSKLKFLVARIDGHVVGTISFGPCGDIIKECCGGELDDLGELGSLYVLPQYQGSGIGSKLIQAMVDYIKTKEIRAFCLDSGYREAQKKWTHKFGVPYKVIKNYWGSGSDHMIWVVRL